MEHVLNIHTRFKYYNALVVIIGSVLIMLGVYDLLNLHDWASEGYRSKNAMIHIAFLLIITGALFTAYFIMFLKIPKKQISDLDSVNILRKKENQFLLGILGSLIAYLISAFLIH